MPVPQVSPIQVFARVGVETGLLGEQYHRKRSLAPLVEALGGVRGDRMEVAHRIFAARLPKYRPDQLLKALQERKTLVRAWGPRGALQIVPTLDLRLYLAAAASTAGRWKKFLDARSNLTTPARLRLLRRICPEVVTRDALREAFPDANTRTFLVREAGVAGHLVWSDGDGSQSTYVWTRNWFGKPVEPDREIHNLVARYLQSYGPVEAADVAGWFGVTVAAARRLMAKHRVVEVQIEGSATPLFIRPEELEAIRATRKSRGKGLVVVPPGDPFRLAYRMRYRLPQDEDGDDGIVLHDGDPVAVWSVGKEGVDLHVKSGANARKVTAAIRDVLDRSGHPAPVPAPTA